MPASSLLVLLDDIAMVLDDVAVLSKVAAKKTAGVLGDDLALNAEQLSGIKAQRELPVIWAVAKGSLLNKCILVPAALVISAFAPWLINYLLIIGGLFLVFEGTEKVFHKFLHSSEELALEHDKKLAQLMDENINLATVEQDKIKGAIRTDFVLSAEIVVIILGTVQSSPLETQVSVLSLMAVLFTIFVYGFVAFIVKLDDMGLYLLRNSINSNFNSLQRHVGRFLLRLAPILMKTLSIVGTAAVFLVGGGILVHAIPMLHHFVEHAVEGIHVYPTFDTLLSSFSAILLNMMIGLISGILVLALVKLYQQFISKKSA